MICNSKIRAAIVTAALVAIPTTTRSGEPALPLTASSIFNSALSAEFAVDGQPDTRWASKGFTGKPEWLLIDFGSKVSVESIIIRWEAAHAQEYQVQVSSDGSDWTVLYHTTTGAGGTERLDGLGASGRFLRIWCIKPGSFNLFSIWEITSKDEATALALRNAKQRLDDLLQVRQIEIGKRISSLARNQGIEEVVFATRKFGTDGHWYSNFGYWSMDAKQPLYRTGGARLCRLNLHTGEVTTLVDDPEGCIRDPQVHYDGQRILFSYLKSGTSNYNLYELDIGPSTSSRLLPTGRDTARQAGHAGSGGTGLRQLTHGPYDDIEPTYLPDGGIIFCSSRCDRWVQCMATSVAILYRCDGDGGNIRPISSNVEHDNTPWVLPDGRVLYMRWEYVDRSQLDYHHLWTCNPDGTEQMVYFGNMHPGMVMLDAKPIPNSRKIVSIFSPGHGMKEHMGQVTIVDPVEGPDNKTFAKSITSGYEFRDPYPLDENHFLAARGSQLVSVDTKGNVGLFYQLPEELIAEDVWLHEPRPLTSRPRETVIPPRTDLTHPTGRLVLANINQGRNMTGVNPGDIRKLLIIESLPKPINYSGGMEPLSYGGTFTLERILGTVPVEPDGSAYLEVPALRSLFFVALDENDMSVKRMQSFLTVQPGETLSCVGCHEQRTTTAVQTGKLMATQRPPSTVTPVERIPDVFDFPRDIQPILDRHCVKCHDYDRRETASGPQEGPRAGGVILTGDHGPIYSHSYVTLTCRHQFVDGRNEPKSNLPPRTIGTSASPIMRKIAGEHYDVVLSAHEVDMIRYWIEAGAPYPGTYAALGSGEIGGYSAHGPLQPDWSWPATMAAAEATLRRCSSCHKGPTEIPRSLSDEMDISFWRPDWTNPRLKHSRHLVFNLSRPEKSVMLLAPLSVAAGGYGKCLIQDQTGDLHPVFADTNDPDYRKLLAMCAAGKQRLAQIKRFDLPGFRPTKYYLREMVRYGVLERIPAPGEPIDPYALDEAYFQSHWFRPQQVVD